MATTRSGKSSPQAIASAIYTRRKALADLMHSQALGEGDIGHAVRQITETAVTSLEVERASVWRIIEDGAAIECVDLYQRSTGSHSSGAVIRATGAASGNQVEASGRMQLNGPAEGPTTMDWSASVELFGSLAGVGSRMIEGTAAKLIDETFACVKARLAPAA